MFLDHLPFEWCFYSQLPNTPLAIKQWAHICKHTHKIMATHERDLLFCPCKYRDFLSTWDSQFKLPELLPARGLWTACYLWGPSPMLQLCKCFLWEYQAYKDLGPHFHNHLTVPVAPRMGQSSSLGRVPGCWTTVISSCSVAGWEPLGLWTQWPEDATHQHFWKQIYTLFLFCFKSAIQCSN